MKAVPATATRLERNMSAAYREGESIKGIMRLCARLRAWPVPGDGRHLFVCSLGQFGVRETGSLMARDAYEPGDVKLAKLLIAKGNRYADEAAAQALQQQQLKKE